MQQLSIPEIDTKHIFQKAKVKITSVEPSVIVTQQKINKIFRFVQKLENCHEMPVNPICVPWTKIHLGTDVFRTLDAHLKKWWIISSSLI